MQVLVHIYSNCILLPHFALGVETLSDQGLAHSTEQPGVSPLRKKGRASKAWFVPTTTCATLLIFLSLPIVTPESFRHLFRHNVCVLLNLSFCHKLCNILFEWLSQHVLHQTGDNPSLNCCGWSVRTLWKQLSNCWVRWRCCWQPNARWSARFCSCTYCWQPGPSHHSPHISFTTTSGGLCTLSMLCSWWLLQPVHTPLPPTLHVYYKAIHADHFLIQVSWSGWFRMFVQLEHWKSAREMLDAAVWSHDGYSGCTTWKLVGTMVLRCFQTVCAVVP